MNREEKLAIAKLAYRDIMDVIEEYEVRYHPNFCAYWDECIGFDEELFHGHELRENK